MLDLEIGNMHPRTYLGTQRMNDIYLIYSFVFSPFYVRVTVLQSHGLSDQIPRIRIRGNFST